MLRLNFESLHAAQASFDNIKPSIIISNTWRAMSGL